MISPDDLREVWHILEMSPPVAGNLRVREAAYKGDAGMPALFGIDTYGHRHVLIPIPPGITIKEDTQSSGVQIIGHSLIDNAVLRNFVDLVCLKPHLHELFLVVVSEILSHLEENPVHPDRVSHQVLDRWRELLEREPSDLPSMEKFTGLFGELWILREIVRLNPLSVQCWTGPTGSRHDVSAGDIAIEVKSSLQRHGRNIEIHGHEQLEPPANGTLYLATLKLELSGLGEALQDVVSSIVASGGDRYSLLTKLALIDITPAILDRCKDTRFSVVECRMYSVEENFPRITANSFVGGNLPTGVVKLTYQIDLTGEPPYPLTEDVVEEVYRTIAAKAKE